MKLYQVAKCPFAHRARIVLEEKNLPYEVVYFEPCNRPEVLVALSPDARSPTLFDDDDTRVWSSLIVIEYLEDRYPTVPLMPAKAADRARARLWMREVEDRLLRAAFVIVDEMVHKPPAQRDESKVQQGILATRDELAAWNARVEGKPYLLGDAFTLADIALYTPLYSMAELLGERGEIPKTLPALRTWRARVAARPSTAY